MHLVQFWQCCDNRALDSAVVLAPEDLEGAVVTPVGVPGVGKEPVGSSVLHSPPEEPDSVTAQHPAVDVLVDARLVVDKVFVDGEGGLGWPVGHQLLHDVPLLVHDVMWLLPISLVVVVFLRVVSVLAVAVALGGSASLTAWLSGAIDMMLARLDVIGLTSNVRSIFASRHKALSLPELPSIVGKSSVASKATAVAATQQILWAHINLDLAL